MRPRREYPVLKLAGTNALMLLGLSGLAALTYVVAGSAYLVVIVRVAEAAAVGLLFLQILKRMRRAAELERNGGVKPDAPSATTPSATIAPRLLRLRDELKHSSRSRRYFEHVLWPELQRLAAARRGTLLSEPDSGWIPGRGPSLRALSAVVEQIEDRGT